jgi:hypothetical protein
MRVRARRGDEQIGLNRARSRRVIAQHLAFLHEYVGPRGGETCDQAEQQDEAAGGGRTWHRNSPCGV